MVGSPYARVRYIPYAKPGKKVRGTSPTVSFRRRPNEISY